MSLADARDADEALSRLPARRRSKASAAAEAAAAAQGAAAIRARMAGTITTHLTTSGGVTEADLARAGFTPDQVKAHFAAAAELAGAAGMAS